MAEEKRVIAVFGATGHQGKGVVQALKTASNFRVRALSRNPQTYTGEADEVLYADLEKPETLHDALKGVYGVFLVPALTFSHSGRSWRSAASSVR